VPNEHANESALATLIRGFRYLKATINLCIAAPRYTDELDLEDVFNKNLQTGSESKNMSFYSDSDYAGNTEPQNKRKNQYGYVALKNGAPVDWFSKCTSVAFADASIGDSHPDVSVAAGEIYAAGNAILVKCYNSHTSLKKSVFLSPNQLSSKWITQQLKLLQTTL